jgi:predicted PurR-regulated permease PerM
MSGTLIAFIILTAIIGGYLIDYQKNKLKWQSNNVESNQDINELQKQLEKVTKRIENLEAIVTDKSFGKMDE